MPHAPHATPPGEIGKKIGKISGGAEKSEAIHYNKLTNVP